ncbi:TonB family protein [Algoriphagus sp. H41]|uniref:TonB family protein n=1 Tax=Algoriphagus oliviformis TaxID=2811231 RepID=A0ABS3C086_9BACT|nr:energy transducer TonB [Algoriphagus oliviformis]MBN7810530.1 TonB family protein [Algoriphagus oliviformis]
MKREVLIRTVLLAVVMALSFHSAVFSQSKDFVIEGKVNDPDGNKAPGATIVLKGTTTGTVTDLDGNFSIKVPTEQAVLVIRHFTTTQVWEDTFDAGKKYVIKLAPDSVSRSSQVFDRVEEVPRPKSGNDGWYAYLAKNIKYPQSARKNGVVGTVIVGFEVHADGSVQNVEILRGIGGECDREAARVVAAGPDWEPGKISGQAVNTRMSIPVQFKLQGAEPSLSDAKENTIARLYGESSLVVIGYLPQASR